MQIEKLTQEELLIFTGYYKRNKMLAPLIPGICLLLLVVWLCTGSDIEEMHWTVAGILFLAFTGFTSYFAWRTRLFRKDISEQNKITGDFKITSTRADGNRFFIWINAGKSSRFPVTNETFNNIKKGNTYHFELTAHARILLKISDGSELIYKISIYACNAAP